MAMKNFTRDWAFCSIVFLLSIVALNAAILSHGYRLKDGRLAEELMHTDQSSSTHATAP